MNNFNWDLARKTMTEEAYDYLLHVQKRNIQEEDFVRGFCSLPTEDNKPIMSKRKARHYYRNLKKNYGFFIREDDVKFNYFPVVHRPRRRINYPY